MNLKFIFCLLGMLFAVAFAHAQASKDSADLAAARQRIRKIVEKNFRIFIGMALGEFSARMPDGKELNNRSLLGKVSLILFWYPTIGQTNGTYSSKYLELGALPALRQQHKDFQIISLVADTSDLAAFRAQNPEMDLFTLANLQSHGEASVLSTGQGMPSCILVDRYGKIARLSMLGAGMLDEQAMADKINELTMQ